VKQKTTPLADFQLGADGFAAALVAPQDPGNLGSILRAIDAVGASGLILLDGGVDPFHPSAMRAGMGSHFVVPIIQAAFKDFRDWAKEDKVHVYGSSAHATLNFREVGYARPAVLLLGSERQGLSEEQQKACDQVVLLPMKGKVTSLNLSVAAGILLYQMAGEEARGER
jgi:TrmH family RNA methyltransferase